MKQEVLIGQTDYTVLVKIRLAADGAPATGLTEASIDIAYARVETDNDVTTTDVTPAALTALTDAHTDWGFEEVHATDHPGVYRLDIADAVFASGAWSAVVSITGATLDPCDLEFVLVAFNPRDGVRLGLTALPNAAAGADAGLPVLSSSGTTLGYTVSTVTTLTNLPSITAGWLTAAGIADDAFTAAKFAADVTTEFQNGLATSAALASLVTTVGVAGAGLTEAGGTGDHLTALATAAALATVDSQVDAAKENTDYPDGYVYLDETNGGAGTTVGTNGTARNPANSWANANTIAVARGVKAVRAVPGWGMSVTISSGTFDNYTIDLNGTSLLLDSSVAFASTAIFSSVAGARAYGATLFEGIVIGQNCFLDNLFVNGLTLTHPQVYIKNCGFYENIVGPPNAGIGVRIRVDMQGCYNAKESASGVAAIDFDLDEGGDFNLQGWYGDLSVSNMAAGTTFTVNGYGKLTIAASCTGGTIKHTSHVEINDLASGAVTTELISEPGDVVDVTGTVSDKMGYALSATGLDLVATTAPAGVASNFREMIVQVWRRFFKRSTLTATELKTYADNGSSVLTTQAVSDDGTTQDQGAAS